MPAHRSSAADLPKSVALHALLLASAFLFLFPFFWMVTTALKTLPEAIRVPPALLPTTWMWSNFRVATEAIPFWRYAGNTLYVAALVVVGTVASCSLAAYGFSRIAWRGRAPLFAVTLATMMIPFPVLMVPQYGIFRSLGWIGGFAPLWVPAFFGSAYNIFLLRQFMRTIPDSLYEAAEIDGCGEMQKFLGITIPLIRPALSVVALFTFLFVWNDFLGPLIYLTEQDTFTLALGLQHFQSLEGGVQAHLLMAASTLTVLPVIGLFFFTQRTFVQGISLSGMKA